MPISVDGVLIPVVDEVEPEPGDLLWCLTCDAEYAFDPDEPHECRR